MSFSFSSLIRLIVVMALGTTMLAVGLSKLDPPKPGWRTLHASTYSNINEYFLNVMDRTPRWLDAETGRVGEYPLEDGDVLEAAGCSPWVDEKGDRQVVGRWSSRTKDGPMSMSTDFGLGRYTFPGGRLLDHVSTEIIPVGPPAWFPGTRARVLFAAGDGNLYHFAFEPEPWMKEADPLAKGDLKPKLVTWKCPKPGIGNIFLSDLTWPEDPRMGGCVVVSLREQSEASRGSRTFTRARLWWLKLNHAGTEVVEAGRLLAPQSDESLDGPCDERSPTIGVVAGGKLVVAYMYQRDKARGWELRLTPVEFEGDHQVPRADESKGVLVVDGCMPSHPTFSTDGRWLNAIVDAGSATGRSARLSIAKLVESLR